MASQSFVAELNGETMFMTTTGGFNQVIGPPGGACWVGSCLNTLIKIDDMNSMFLTAAAGGSVLLSLKDDHDESKLLLASLSEVRGDKEGLLLKYSKNVETKGKAAKRYEDNNKKVKAGKYTFGRLVLIGVSEQPVYTTKIANVRKNRNEEGSYIIKAKFIELKIVDNDEYVVESKGVKVESGLHGVTGQVDVVASGIKMRGFMTLRDNGEYQLLTDSIEGSKQLDEMIEMQNGDLIILPLVPRGLSRE